MAVELWVGQEFSRPYERKALERFVVDMETEFGHTDELYLVLANYTLLGSQIDVTVLKRNAIIIIELKERQEAFKAYENGLWLTIPEGKKVGTGDRNPYEQVKSYRLKWADFLKDNRGQFSSLAQAENIVFFHTSAVVAISPFLHPDTENHMPGLIWFKLVGLNKLAGIVGRETSQGLQFSDEELRKLTTELLRLRQVPRPQIARRSQKIYKPNTEMERLIEKVEELTASVKQGELASQKQTSASNIAFCLLLMVLMMLLAFWFGMNA